MNKIHLEKVIIILVLLIGSTLAIIYKSQPEAISTPTPSTIMATVTPSNSPSQTTEPNIIIMAPQADATIKSPTHLQGSARVFENTFRYRIRDEDGSILTEASAMASASDTGLYGDFDIKVRFPKPKGIQGTVEVFQYSAKDGSEIDKVIVPVVFDN